MELVQVAQRAVELDRAARWYAKLLQAQPRAAYDPPGLVFFDVGGVRLMLERGVPSALLYLAVPDLGAALARLAAPVKAEPHVIFKHADDTLGPAGTEEWQAAIEDSEGNLVVLVEQRRG